MADPNQSFPNTDGEASNSSQNNSQQSEQFTQIIPSGVQTNQQAPYNNQYQGFQQFTQPVYPSEQYGQQPPNPQYQAPLMQNNNTPNIGLAPNNGPNAASKTKKPIWKKWWFWVIIVFVIAVLGNLGGTNNSTSEGSSATSQSQNDNKKSVEQKKKTILQKISVSYNGSTAAGTQIDGNTSDIAVVAYYSDGKSVQLKQGEWELTNPAQLASGQSQTFTVKYKDKTADFTVNVPESESDYKARAENIAYADLARNPDTYKGHTVHFRGKLIQVIDGGGTSESQYRVNVTEDEYGLWDDTVLISFNTDPNQRFLEDDIVEFWGDSVGTITYKSVLGGDITIPAVSVKYMQLSQ